MLLQLSDRKCVLVDAHKLPRYWSSVWSIYHEGGLAESTHRQKLRDIEALYNHAESINKNLDDSLALQDLEALGIVLESFFVKLRNTNSSGFTATRRWNNTFHFVRNTCERLEKDPSRKKMLGTIEANIRRLDNLYLGLRPFKCRNFSRVRAIPRTVLLEIIEMIQPGSERNPFEYTTTQWRVFALISLLLFQGLRTGEALTLLANFHKTDIDHITGRKRSFLSVQTDESRDDPRSSKPSIKTMQSIRSIPMSEQTGQVMQAYLENFRGRPTHPFFLNSIQNKPLSPEGVRKLLDRLSKALSVTARETLKEVTGFNTVTPHDFRHTCAVIRMKQWLESGLSPEQSMSHMRSFFGWSRTSTMPLLYAKAALDERLNDSWNDAMDDRLNMLRNLI